MTTSTMEIQPGAATKLCHLIKRDDFDGYGFNLHSEKSKAGQFIGKVDAHSPAEAAGLREGERIVEVNGVPIRNETHRQVVQRIKALAGEVRLLLVSLGENESAITPVLEATNKRTTETSGNAIVLNSNENNENALRQHGNSPAESTNSLSENTVAKEINRTTTAMPNTVKNGGGEDTPSNASIPLKHSNNDYGDALQLPLTAAEMRAKLMAKKKYDPKNELVDLKKKFDIIQKL